MSEQTGCRSCLDLFYYCVSVGLLNKFLTVTEVRGETPQETGAHERLFLSLANAHNQCVHSVIHSHTIHVFFTFI